MAWDRESNVPDRPSRVIALFQFSVSFMISGEDFIFMETL